MTFIYKTAKFAPDWTNILKISASFVHKTSTEHALYATRERSTVTEFGSNTFAVIFTKP